jgi:acetyl/propionyl-CoA carboxylase alpha subunit/acetyl-CoA carboxylase carboxyltransferase component
MTAQPPFRRMLIANRGEIALRIARAAAELNIETVAIHPADDAGSLHVRRAGRAIVLPGTGARAYLDIAAVVKAGVAAGCDAVHPGYGFLSESPGFAQAAQDAGMAFIGPTPAALALFGDKGAARALAVQLGVPVAPGTAPGLDAGGALAFFDALPTGTGMMIKAAHGGGGRGMRAVFARGDVPTAHRACAAEAEAAFGNGALYAEAFLPGVRHLEVQILGDGTGAAVHFGERECTLQRRNQKLVEIAPSPTLSADMRDALNGHALALAMAGRYRGLGTFEFLLQAGGTPVFIEANPRVQVEHTVTEEVFGVDLVRLQIEVCAGRTLADLGVSQAGIGAPRGYAVQARVCLERMTETGAATPTGGVISAYEAPSGRGVRVDGFGYAGYATSAAYDSLLAKVIFHSFGDFPAALAGCARALAEFRIDGPATNIPWLRALLARDEVRESRVDTGFIEAAAPALFAAAAAMDPPLFPTAPETSGPETSGPEASGPEAIPDGLTALSAPMQGTVASVATKPGDMVRAGQVLVILEAMKMEHTVAAEVGGIVRAVLTTPGDTVREGAALVLLEPRSGAAATATPDGPVDLDAIRPDLAELRDRTAAGLDETRPEAVAKRHARGHQTARENLGAMCDAGAFREYGALAVAAQGSRRSLADLIANTSGDGVVTGIGAVNGDLFAEDASACAFAVYDYMVLAGTQGVRNHGKQDRLFGLAEKWNLPVILLAEGGGGRPGDVDQNGGAGLNCASFGQFARLSGKVPLVGVVSGRCFAGNAALLGCCDVIIADESSNIGMAGPAMIEGGGLGIYPPEAIGPIGDAVAGGVVDIRVKDEIEACATAKQYLSYFQGDLKTWEAPDQRHLRRAIHENRLRSHDVRAVINTLSDEGSVLELRRGFGAGMVTALVRIEGRACGLIANNSMHLGGAIDAPAADKASRFMQLCDGFGLPIISLCDTPGFMVGPEAERTGLVRHVCRMFVTAASLTVPIFGVALRKGYGLGAMAMMGGGFHDTLFTASWPTGEFGGMGLEGAVRLGFKKELAAIPDPAAQKALFDRLLAEYYENGKAVALAQCLEVDAVIDPAETRDWIMGGLRAAPRQPWRGLARRPFIDTW